MLVLVISSLGDSIGWLVSMRVVAVVVVEA